MAKNKITVKIRRGVRLFEKHRHRWRYVRSLVGDLSSSFVVVLKQDNNA